MFTRSVVIKSVVALSLMSGLFAATAVAVYGHDSSGEPAGEPIPATRTRLASPLDGLSGTALHDKMKDLDAEAEATQQAFRQQFVASGADFHSLPDDYMTGTVMTTASLAELTELSDAVIVGKVQRQELTADGGSVESVVRVDDVLAGKSIATGSEMTISQVGAPTMIGESKVLLQLPGDAVLIGDNTYVLFVQNCVSPDGAAEGCLVRLGSQYTVTDGVLTARLGLDGPDPDYWASGLTGLTIDQLRAMLAGLPTKNAP